jgi:hypothetical protein
MAKLSGGGIQSNKLVRPGVKGGSRSANVGSPAGVDQLGAAQGSRMKEGSYTTQSSATPLFSGSKPNPVAFGNQLATNVGQGGPGAGRTVMRSGSQGTHGPVAGSPEPQGRDILGSFGPESSRGR